jgi:hypothetical protein
MAIDNLPSELPRDASVFFGNQFIENILPEILAGDPHGVIERGTIAEEGALTEHFGYLAGYVSEPVTA